MYTHVSIDAVAGFIVGLNHVNSASQIRWSVYTEENISLRAHAGPHRMSASYHQHPTKMPGYWKASGSKHDSCVRTRSYWKGIIHCWKLLTHHSLYLIKCKAHQFSQSRNLHRSPVDEAGFSGVGPSTGKKAFKCQILYPIYRVYQKIISTWPSLLWMQVWVNQIETQ